MRYYVEGVNNKVSAEKLGINGKTLSRYKRNAMVKLNINNNRDFFRWLPKSYDYGNNGDCFI
ncbi:LuxR C-terminal-related transcriptional regulator [Serratia sp. L9]|uniref:LuxR C-terminal-related transcriptional regulator n=1 Tax=Serratia sp. L9 TaxID=3423946 RepID=UPI003D67883F